MKYTFLSCVAALALLPCQAAVQQADTYEASKPLVQDDGYIIFAYAEDWDTFSKRVCDKLMTSEAVLQAAGNAVFMRAPIPNVLTDERKAANKEKYGPLNVADAPSYPAILLLTKSGRHYATICGSVMRKAAPKKISKMIQERIAAMKHQEALLAQAKAAKGIERAKLLGEAASIPDISPDGKLGAIINEIKKLDPQDTTGYARKLRDPFSFVGEIVGIERDKSKSWQEALAKVDEYLNDPVYTPAHQQALHALAIGLLHRHGSLKDAAAIRKHAAAIEALDSKSYIGQSAQYATREWATSFNLVEGWNPAVMQQSAQGPVEVEAPLPFSTPGIYTFIFNYKNGSDAASIAAVSLYDGDKLVAEDRHAGFAGKMPNNNIYKLKLDSVPAAPRLMIEFNQKGKNNSSGLIEVTRG